MKTDINNKVRILLFLNFIKCNIIVDKYLRYPTFVYLVWLKAVFFLFIMGNRCTQKKTTDMTQFS